MHYAILFPGQGSQEKGMGRDVAEVWPEAMELWKTAERLTKAPLREIYWDGDEEAMAATRYLQPALTVVNATLWAKAKEKIRPLAVAGHSLGEWSALAAAGALAVPEVLEAVVLRGRLMDEAAQTHPGAMAAILKLSQAEVEAVVAQGEMATGELVRIANYNTPKQHVVSGDRAAVDWVCAAVKERKGRAIMLPVSGAFHTPLVAEAAREFARFVEGLSWRAPNIPIVLNTTGASAKDVAHLVAAMQEQMTASVRWTQGVQTMAHMGADVFVEVGPKGVLARMVGQILPETSAQALHWGSLAQMDKEEEA